MRAALFLAVPLLLCASGLRADEPPAYGAGVQRLVQDLTARLPQEAGDTNRRVIVVEPFTCGGNGTDAARFAGRFGEALSDDITAAFVNQGKVRVVARDKLGDLRKEKMLWISTDTNPPAAPKNPKGFSPAALLVHGKYFADARTEDIRLSADLIDIDSGEKLASASVSISRKTAPILLNGEELGLVTRLSANLQEVASAAGAKPPAGQAAAGDDRVRVRVWCDAGHRTFRTGELIQVKVAVDQDAYVWLFDVRPDGKTVMIFPNAYHAANFLRAGEVLAVPTEKMEFKLEIMPPYGPEAIQAVATASPTLRQEFTARGGLEPPKSAANPFSEVSAGTKGVAAVIREVTARGIGVVPSDPAPKEKPPSWAEDHWTFVTEK